MLVLVSFGLVLLATILLVVGLLTDDGLTLIYFSIGASFTAAIVLYLAFRMARPKAEKTKTAPEPLDPDLAPEPELVTVAADATAVQPAAAAPVAAATPAAAVVPDTAPEPAPEPTVFTSDASSARDDDWTADDDWADDGDFEVEFPIADYDELTVAEIMPLLPQLYTDELGVVAERERNGKNRAAILDRLDELAASGTDADALEADEDEDVAAPAAPVAPAPAPAPAAAPTSARPAVTVPSLSDDDDDELPFPIADYDELTVDQIVPLLAQLEDDELEDVKAREAAGQARMSVIAEIDRQLGLVDAADADTSDEAWEPEVEPAAPVAPATPTTRSTPEPAPAPHAEPAEGSALAIAGYDGLTVAQIRPLLTGLTDRELRAVLEHEAARDNRRTIITEIERRLDSSGASAAPAARPAKATAAPAKRAAKKAAKRPQRAAKKAAAPRFPIAGYDELRVAEIRPRLAGLTKAQLEQVRDRELAGAGRKTILTEIENRLR